MARKKTEKPAMPATQPEMRSVRLYLPLDDHRRLRRLAADNETNMAILARRIVQDYIAKHPLKGEGRSS
jgi:hypothetical protein